MAINDTWPSGRPKGWSISGGLPLSPPWPAPNLTQLPRQHVPLGMRLVRVGLSPPLAALERGALILPPSAIQKRAGGGFSVTPTEFDPDVVRAALLLFERMDYPENNIFGMPPQRPEGLEDAEFIQRTKVFLEGNITSALQEFVLGHAFDKLNQREPGRWALARNVGDQSLPKELLGEQCGFILKLYDALPVPDRCVSYEEVLNYRERRRSELMALRHHIEELSIQVARDGFGGLAETVAFERFEAALVDHAKACREANFLKRLMSLDISFNWSGFGKSLAVAAPVALHGFILKLYDALP